MIVHHSRHVLPRIKTPLPSNPTTHQMKQLMVHSPTLRNQLIQHGIRRRINPPRLPQSLQKVMRPVHSRRTDNHNLRLDGRSPLYRRDRRMPRWNPNHGFRQRARMAACAVGRVKVVCVEACSEIRHHAHHVGEGCVDLSDGPVSARQRVVYVVSVLVDCCSVPGEALHEVIVAEDLGRAALIRVRASFEERVYQIDVHWPVSCLLSFLIGTREYS